MIRIFLGEAAPMAKLEWSVYKGASGVKEDFGCATVFLWMIGAGNRFLVDCTTEDGMIKAVIPSMLPEGVYDLRAMWIKEENCCKRSMSEVEKAFGVTYDPEEATPVVGDSCTIKVKSCTATYGYDGLSAYEMSVLKGKTTMSEEEWIVYQNGIPAEVSEQLDGRFLQSFGNEEHKGISQKVLTETKNDLQDQINAIVSGQAEVALAATPSPVFVGVQSDISLSATTNIGASSIKIKKGTTELASGSGMSLSGSDTIIPSVAGNTTYNAEFVIAGLPKAATPKSVAAVHRIYYGAAAANDWESITNYDHTPRTSPSGVTYNVNIATNGQHVFFIIPASMIGNKTVTAKKNGFNFPLKAPVDATKTDGGVEVAYKVYQDASDVGYTQGTESITLTIN